jgi:PKD repeat protein
VISWNWDFGDGGVATIQNPTHTYANPGLYLVSLYIETADSCFTNYFEYVFPGDTFFNQCYASYSYMPDMSALNGFFFQDLSSPNAISWFWDFGDGTFSSQQNPHHIFQNTGMYVVTLSITTADSCFNSFSSVLMVGNPWGCQAAFQSTPTPSNPFTYMFTDFSTGNVIDWAWDFGDGGISNIQNPVHTYGAPGMYLVTLSISTSDSCWSSFVDFVYPGDTNTFNCFADFNYFPDSSGFGFTFVDFSTGNPIDWTWDFGDGSFATGPVVNHIYTQAGSYMACLTITTASGCVNTHCYMVTVSGGGMFGNITGWVTANNSFLDEGTVILYVRDPFTGTAFPMDTATIDTAGYYGFCCLPIGLGDFYLKAVPAPNSVFFNTHLPTYYESAAFWADADPVNPDPTAGPYLIELQPVITPAPGNGGIGGIITQGNKLYASGTPLANVEIMILDMNNTPLMMDYSDVAGQFYFANIPMGTYKVYAEVAFVPTSPAIVTLNTGNPINTGVSIVYTPGGISTGIDNPVGGSAVTELVSVYPNPATDKVNVILNAAKAENMQLTLTDIHGRILFTKEISLSTGEQMISLPVDEYTTGLYLLNISNGGSFSQNLKIHVIK